MVGYEDVTKLGEFAEAFRSAACAQVSDCVIHWFTISGIGDRRRSYWHFSSGETPDGGRRASQGTALQFDGIYIMRHPLKKGIGLFTLSVEIAGGDGLVHPFKTDRIHAAQILDY